MALVVLLLDGCLLRMPPAVPEQIGIRQVKLVVPVAVVGQRWAGSQNWEGDNGVGNGIAMVVALR